jgi:hypothetical protein
MDGRRTERALLKKNEDLDRNTKQYGNQNVQIIWTLDTGR